MKRIDALPDDVLLEIFYFYLIIHPSNYESKTAIEAWQSLVHVCRRWRSVVLGSPRGLNLQLYCTAETPVKETLDVWPALPLLVRGDVAQSSPENAIAALGQSNRVRLVNLHLERWQLEQVLAPMRVPFPELTDLRLSTSVINFPNLEPIGIPDSFLGGSATRLRNFSLHNIPFRGLPKLLSSCTHLVSLGLTNVPDSWCISPEAMIDLLSVLSRLRTLCLKFRTPFWKSRSLPPPKHTILPSLREFRFTGLTRYLEALVPNIDTPQLDEMHINFINSSNFACLQLAQFINRTPTLRSRDTAHFQFDNWTTGVALRARSSTLEVETRCSLETFIRGLCNFSLHPLSTVENLYIEHQHLVEVSPIQDTQWLGLLLPFTAVKNLSLSKKSAPGVAAALPVLGRGITEVLPRLKNVFVETPERSGPFRKDIRRFVTARKLSGHPVAISIRDKPVWNWAVEQEEESALCIPMCLAWRQV